jgi:hypothetical protein
MTEFWDSINWREQMNPTDVFAEIQRNEKYIEVLKKRNSKLLAGLFEEAARGSKNRPVHLLGKEQQIVKKFGGRGIQS